MRSRSRSRLAALGLVLLAGGCGHDLRSGGYVLTQTGAPREDTCHLLPSDGSLSMLYLTKMGEEVRIELELFGPEAPVRMIGRFKRSIDGEPDQFSADGSVGDVVIDVDGQRCTVEFGQVHLDATISEGSDTSFEGVLTVYQTLVPDQELCPLTCRAEVSYSAEKMR
ncbi:MAG: hypothetical protein ACOX6T_18670 [Myxococcales bacterium]